MDDSTLGRLVDSYNTDLDKLTTTQSQALLDAWTAGQRDVTEQLARLQDRIQQATDAGETVSPSWLLQRDRLTDVNNAVARQITAVSNVLGRTVPAAIQQAATLGDTHAAALISELDPYGIAAQLGGVNTPAVTNLTAAVSAGGPLDKVLAGFANPGPMQDRIRGELTAGIITGRNPRETARRIRQVSATGTLARAETIARTETLRAYRGAQQQAYDTSPVVDGWTWLSAQNARTCTACWVMTGSVHPTTEKLAGHVNCRCRMIPRTPSWESLGFTGLPETNPQVPAGPDTLAAMPADELVHIIGPDKYRRYKAGELALSDLVAETDSPVWGRSVRVASTSEALDNAKARKAGQPTPGQVPYKPGTGPVPPPKAPPAPKPTPPTPAAPKPVPPVSADNVPGVSPVSGTTMTGARYTPTGTPLTSRVTYNPKTAHLRSITDRLGAIHGSPDVTVDIVMGGKSTNLGGKYSPRTRDATKPKRPSMSKYRGDPDGYAQARAEYNARVAAYNASPLISRISLNKRGTNWAEEHPLTLTHELGHHLDLRGTGGSRMTAARQRLSQAGQIGDKVDLSKITDPEELFIAVCRQSDAYRKLGESGSPKWTAYARDPVELWARAYSQWAMNTLGDEASIAALRRYQGTKTDGYHWTDEEFRTIAPLVEGVLRKWQLMDPAP